MEKKKKSFSNARKKTKFRNCMWDRTPVPLHLCPTEEDSGVPATMIKQSEMQPLEPKRKGEKDLF